MLLYRNFNLHTRILVDSLAVYKVQKKIDCKSVFLNSMSQEKHVSGTNIYSVHTFSGYSIYLGA